MNRRNRLRRVALVLALFVLAATVTGVAESATKTAIPKQLTGRWSAGGAFAPQMEISPRGKVVFYPLSLREHAEFSRVTPHRLTVTGMRSSALAPCSGPGTYRWNVASHHLKFTKIVDWCKWRVTAFTYSGTWLRYKG